MPDTRGWRNDVLQALKRIGVPVMRSRGACFADDYDWRDGLVLELPPRSIVVVGM